MDGKHLMRFQSEISVFTLLRGSVNSASENERSNKQDETCPS